MRKLLAMPIPTAHELEAFAQVYRTTRDVRLRTRSNRALGSCAASDCSCYRTQCARG
jgi:hypothetical protein